MLIECKFSDGSITSGKKLLACIRRMGARAMKLNVFANYSIAPEPARRWQPRLLAIPGIAHDRLVSFWIRQIAGNMKLTDHEKRDIIKLLEAQSGQSELSGMATLRMNSSKYEWQSFRTKKSGNDTMTIVEVTA